MDSDYRVPGDVRLAFGESFSGSDPTESARPRKLVLSLCSLLKRALTAWSLIKHRSCPFPWHGKYKIDPIEDTFPKAIKKVILPNSRNSRGSRFPRAFESEHILDIPRSRWNIGLSKKYVWT